MKKLLLLVLFFGFKQINAQGTWTPLNNTPSYACGGVMLLLSDGTVIAKTFDGGTDGIGNIWNKLTPDSTGSYINGTWSTIAPMYDTRLYFSSQMMMDGRVYVAGGEYGSGGPYAEIYDPLTDVWTQLPSPVPSLGDTLEDPNSAILPDGRVLQSVVKTADVNSFSDSTTIYDPLTNTYAIGPKTLHSFDEASWVKLPDNSILYVDFYATTSERYIPALNQWIADANVPTTLYGQYDYETGPGLLLPDGRVFFTGSNGHTAYYTPSGTNAHGSWAVGPTIPDSLGAVDAPGAMMVNGKILYSVSPVSTNYTDLYLTPTYYYEFDYTTNVFTNITSPDGSASANEACYSTIMLDLPDGNVLYGDFDSYQYYVYTPDGTPLTVGKPVINSVIENQCNYSATGVLFNGISEGAAYGDDWQMSTNFPIIRLSNATNTYYARTFNWNSTSVQTGSFLDTTQFTLPANLPAGTYSLVVVANGISSDPYTFVYSPCFVGIKQITANVQVDVFPNPASNSIEISTHQNQLTEINITDMLGRSFLNNVLDGKNSSAKIDISGFPNGVYFVNVKTNAGNSMQKIVVQH